MSLYPLFVLDPYKAENHFRNRSKPDDASYWVFYFFSFASRADNPQDSLDRITRDGSIFMSSATGRRGRPKGSGLDDRAQLRRIEALLDADPGLRPTTAIKSLGISDPSTIRRLRDKLKDQDSPAAVSVLAGLGPLQQPALSARDVRPARPEPHSEPSSLAHAGSLVEVSESGGAASQAPWFLDWYAFGLSAVSSTFEAQMAFMDDLLHAPHVEHALRHQLLLNELAKAFCPKRPDIRSRLH